MNGFDRAMVAGTDGYYPLADAASALLETRLFSQVLLLGPGSFDFADLVGTVRHIPVPDDVLPEGVYWFSSAAPPSALIVHRGKPPGPPIQGLL